MSETLTQEKPIEAKEQIKSQENKTLAILTGKKTMLFPFEKQDLSLFLKLHREDKKGYLGQFCLKYMNVLEALNYVNALFTFNKIHVWTVYTKETKPRVVGFVYLSDLEKYKCSISGVVDGEFLRGLARELRRDKYTYTEDAFRALIHHTFTTSIMRIEANVAENNRLSLAMCKKVGFIVEGNRRKSMEMDGQFLDVLYLSILKEEFEK